jgi:hypothetical protein
VLQCSLACVPYSIIDVSCKRSGVGVRRENLLFQVAWNECSDGILSGKIGYEGGTRAASHPLPTVPSKAQCRTRIQIPRLLHGRRRHDAGMHSTLDRPAMNGGRRASGAHTDAS